MINIICDDLIKEFGAQLIVGSVQESIDKAFFDFRVIFSNTYIYDLISKKRSL